MRWRFGVGIASVVEKLPQRLQPRDRRAALP